MTEKPDNVEKIEIRRNPKSHQIKALKALVKIDSYILNMTIDTGSPVSLLNWATTKQILEGPSNSKFIPAEKLNLSAQYVDYNKRPILILGALRANLRSAGWEVLGAMLLVTERRMRCILGLDLQSKLGIQTTQKSAPTRRSRFDVLLCEQLENWKNLFYSKFKDLFDRQGESKNHTVSTKFKYPLCPIQEKGRRIPIHIQDKVQTELEKLLKEGHIEKLDKCTSDCFIAPIVITVKKDNSIKLALDAKPINRQLYKNKYQMPNVDELIDGVSQIITSASEGSLYFTVLDLKYAYSQIRLTAETAKQCNFNIVGGNATGTYRFLTGFYGLADKPAEFQKAMDRTLNYSKNTFCFLDDILIVSKGEAKDHEKLVRNVLQKLDDENLALKISKCEFFQPAVNWLGHNLSIHGIIPKITKTEAIANLQTPKSLKQLRSFMGSINHLSKLIPNAASLTEKLRPLLKEENEKKKMKNVRLPVKNEWNDQHSVAFEDIKKAVANIALLNYYDPLKQTRIKCDASHSGLGATLEQWSHQNEWIPIAFASRSLNSQEQKHSTNELELLAVVWAVDRFKHYLLGKEFVIATDHKALTSALGEHRSNKTYQSRLTRWVDRLLPYQFTITHIPGRDMGIVDYLSREPNGEPWPESELDEKFVVTSIESFHTALDCLSSRFSETNQNSAINILEHSRITRETNYCKNSSSRGCYDNQFVQNLTKLDRNENGQNSSFQTDQNQKNTKNTLDKLAREKQLVDKSKFNTISIKQKDISNSKQSADFTKAALEDNMEKSNSGKLKKTSNRQNENRKEDELTEQVTETTFSRTRLVKRGAACSRQESDDSESDVPQVEWRTVRKPVKSKGCKEITSGNTAGNSETTLMSFWDLMGAEKPNNPKSILELEARTVLDDLNRSDLSLESNTQRGNPQIIEVDLTAESPPGTPEVSIVTKDKTGHDSRRSRSHQRDTSTEICLDNLTKLFDRSLLAELISEDVWMDRLRRVIERNDRYSFELMGPYTNPLWHQLSVVDDCILVDNRLAVPEQLRLAVLKRIHRGYPGQEAMLDVSKYLW